MCNTPVGITGSRLLSWVGSTVPTWMLPHGQVLDPGQPHQRPIFWDVETVNLKLAQPIGELRSTALAVNAGAEYARSQRLYRTLHI